MKKLLSSGKKVKKKIVIRGETQRYDEERGILFLHIREPFYSAGKQFRWSRFDLSNTVGLGISKSALLFALRKGLSRVRVTVGNSEKVYAYNVLKWIAFSERSRSIMKKKETEIYVIPWNEKYYKLVTEKVEYYKMTRS